MTKKEYIALADKIRDHNRIALRHNSSGYTEFTPDQVEALAEFCAAMNPAFHRQRWLDYIAGKVGPNGGKLR